MQFNLEKGGTGYTIEKRETDAIVIDGKRYTASLILFADKLIDNWPVTDIKSLGIDSLAPVIDAQPEVFLLGTGERQVFPPISLMGELAQRRQSIDVMDSAAACRTYNVLVSEFRQVALALILP